MPQPLSHSLFLALLGGKGRLTLPPAAASQNIHEICPTKRIPFTRSHPLLTASLSILTCRVSLLKGKQKKLRGNPFSSSEAFHILHVRRAAVTSQKAPDAPARSSLDAPSKTPSAELAVRRGKSSHSSVDDTQRDRITWRQTNAIVQKIVQKSVDRGRSAVTRRC